jgi:hypothetical protein
VGIEVLILDKLSGGYVVWRFLVNDYGFVDVYIEGKATDTLFQMGQVDSYDQLSSMVMKQLTEWGVSYHSYARASN